MVRLNTELIPDPVCEGFRARLAALREEYASLLGEYAKLSGPVARRLTAEYQLLFGQKEALILSLELDILCLQREFSLRQAALNHGMTLTDEAVAQTLKREFQEYQKAVDEKYEEFQKAQQSLNGERVSEEDIKELKSLFHQLAKWLHPDLNPGLPPIARELWMRALDAYQRNDLAQLRLVMDLKEELLSGEVDSLEDAVGPDDLQQRIRELEAKIAEITKQIAALKSRFPFTEQALLSNPTAIAERRADLDRQIENLQENKKALTALLETLRGGGCPNG